MGGNPDSDEDTDQRHVAGEMVRYLQKIFGCSLTGDTSEKNSFVFNGGTDTGKTTLLETIRDVVPDYSVTIPIESLMTLDRNSSRLEEEHLTEALATTPPLHFYEKVIKSQGRRGGPPCFFLRHRRCCVRWRGELSRAPFFGVHLDP